MKPDITLTHIDTACMLLEINGYKILTDPTLDRAGKIYYHGYGTFSRKTSDPVWNEGDLDGIDLVLLSHHQHKDNFDNNGKKLTSTVQTVISTKAARRAMPGTIGLDDWESIAIDTPKVPNLKITATPAQHHPWWIPEFLSGKVIGFVIEFEGQQNGVVYISGDTVYFGGIGDVAKHFPKIDIGIFHVGAVQFRYLTGFGQYTMDSRDLLKSVDVLNPRRVVPIHQKGWTHFKEKESDLMNILKRNLTTRDRVTFLRAGEKTKF
ncbi:MBL fold metallo-hydrolase [Chryseolinea lacunae]|uniref:MBL fold metallo-hydrolase n=1 Tax=Chryseolinea lacunae TaxID=2801331 RepID=A0ABS1KVH2_9BACT|nr:MBL fold metallo-hydrolase [Chryseolinea lacunae]MBL0742687.1 MBL fold metallo-hydrolase [Chryseolinea lacunae]